MFVFDRMTKNPVAITPGTPVTTAGELMRENRFRRLPVIEKEKLVGWVTDDDLRQVAPSSATTLSIYEMNYLLAKLKIEEVMKKDLITVQEDAPIEEAALLMMHNKIGGLPVLNQEEKLVGVITETDIFKAFLDMSGVSKGDATRFTLRAVDKIGVLASVGRIFADLGLSIRSFAQYLNGDGEVQMVVRIYGDHETALKAVPEFEKLGIQVVAVHSLSEE